MADIEKVKDGLKIHSTAYTCTEKCPYYNPGEYGCADTLTADALTIIEELQAEIKRLQPKKGEWEPMEDYDDVVYRCSSCEEEWTLIEGTPFDNGMKFCPHCGADMRDSYHFVSNL